MAKKKAKRATGCKCIVLCNKEMARLGMNTVIDAPLEINFVTGVTLPPRCYIVTRKLNDRVRTKCKRLAATYCPICGKKYKE